MTRRARAMMMMKKRRRSKKRMIQIPSETSSSTPMVTRQGKITTRILKNNQILKAVLVIRRKRLLKTIPYQKIKKALKLAILNL